MVLEIAIFCCQIETTDQILHTECQSNEYIVFVSSLTTFIRPRKHILLEVKRAIRAECIVLSTFSWVSWTDLNRSAIEIIRTIHHEVDAAVIQERREGWVSKEYRVPMETNRPFSTTDRGLDPTPCLTVIRDNSGDFGLLPQHSVTDTCVLSWGWLWLGDGCVLYDNGLYQLKVDVTLLNTVKNELADVSCVSPSSEQAHDPFGWLDIIWLWRRAIAPKALGHLVTPFTFDLWQYSLVCSEPWRPASRVVAFMIFTRETGQFIVLLVTPTQINTRTYSD